MWEWSSSQVMQMALSNQGQPSACRIGCRIKHYWFKTQSCCIYVFWQQTSEKPGIRQKSQTYSCLENVGKRMSDEANKQTNKQHNIKSKIPPSVVLMVKIFADLGLLCWKYCHIDALASERNHYVKLKWLGSKPKPTTTGEGQGEEEIYFNVLYHNVNFLDWCTNWISNSLFSHILKYSSPVKLCTQISLFKRKMLSTKNVLV